MKKQTLLIVCLLLWALALSAADTERYCPPKGGACLTVQKSTVHIRIKDEANAWEVLNRLSGLVDVDDLNVLSASIPNTFRLHSRSLTTQQMMDKLDGDRDLRWVEPNAYREGGTQGTPNDPYFLNAQWAMGGLGASGSGLADDCQSYAEYSTGANVAPAWDVTTGSSSIGVFIDDSGWLSHSDLNANKWSSPTGFTVMVNGSPLTCPAGTSGFNFYNWPTVSCDPTDDETFSHGTAVSGIIGAIGNNSVGVTGVNRAVTMVMMKGVGFAAPIDAQQIAVADVAYQLNDLFPSLNLRVTNNSWTYASYQVPSQALHDEYALASSKNMLIVFAAGNNAVDIDQTGQHIYPGYWMHDIDAIVNVGGQMCGGNVMYNYGGTSVHLAAPSFAVYTTSNNCSSTNDAGNFRCGPGNSTYAYMGGTSAASPMVAGTAALLWSYLPGATYLDIKTAILNGVVVDSRYSGKYTTSGRLDSWGALKSLMAAHPVRASHSIQLGN